MDDNLQPRSRALNMCSIWGLLLEQQLYITLQKAESWKDLNSQTSTLLLPAIKMLVLSPVRLCRTQ